MRLSFKCSATFLLLCIWLSMLQDEVMHGYGWHIMVMSAACDLRPVTRREVVETSPGIRWDDIAGLGEAKRLLQENVILPLYMPDFFQGIRRPVKVIDLHDAYLKWGPCLPDYANGYSINCHCWQQRVQALSAMNL